jgi:hypothetical protein
MLGEAAGVSLFIDRKNNLYYYVARRDFVRQLSFKNWQVTSPV